MNRLKENKIIVCFLLCIGPYGFKPYINKNIFVVKSMTEFVCNFIPLIWLYNHDAEPFNLYLRNNLKEITFIFQL